MRYQLKASPRGFIRALAWLRILAVLLQIAVIAVVYRWLDLALPLVPMGLVIFLYLITAALTLLRLRAAWPATQLEVALQLGIDIAALTGLIYMSGGDRNPFISLYLVPIVLAAVGLSRRYVWGVTFACLAGYAFVKIRCLPLYRVPQDPSAMFDVYCLGMAVNFTIVAVLLATSLSAMTKTMRDRDRQLSRLREDTLRQEHLNAIGMLAAGTAHELSTPLATMALLVSELRQARQEDRAQTEAVDTLSRQIQLCKQKLAMLLQTAEARHSPEARVVRLADLMELTLDAWRLVHPGMILEVVASGSARDMYLKVDDGFSQALTNLLNNAAQASGSKGSNHITLTVSSLAGGVNIVIDDEGPGLDVEMERLAGKAFISTKAEGFGLGLVLSHVNLNRLGGELTLANRGEGGTRTTIIMPSVSG
jgi:two-component system sensor histidine kinase RegB